MLESCQCAQLLPLTLQSGISTTRVRTATNPIGEQDNVGHSRGNVFTRFTSLSVDCRVVVAAAPAIAPRPMRSQRLSDSPTVSSMNCRSPLAFLAHRRFVLSLDYSRTKGMEKKLELHGYVIDYLTVADNANPTTAS